MLEFLETSNCDSLLEGSQLTFRVLFANQSVWIYPKEYIEGYEATVVIIIIKICTFKHTAFIVVFQSYCNCLHSSSEPTTIIESLPKIDNDEYC